MIVDVGLRRFSGNAIQRQALLILQSYGADAHSYIPGIGTVSGLVAGNWEDSAGTTPATKDGLVGKVDDATSTIDLTQATTANKPFLRKGAVNLLNYSNQLNQADWGKTRATVSVDNKFAADSTPDSNHSVLQNKSVSGVTNTVQFKAKAAEISLLYVQIGSAIIRAFNLATGTLGSYSLGTSTATIAPADDGYYLITLTGIPSSSNLIFFLGEGDGSTLDITLAGVRTGQGLFIKEVQLEVGASASTYVQTTTAPLSNGIGNYHWVFDSTDLLSGTFPAGYESATIIDARSTGTVTQTAQNIVGTYSIGTSVDTYGRFIFRTGLTASETVIMQQFANSLRGF